MVIVLKSTVKQAQEHKIIIDALSLVKSSDKATSLGTYEPPKMVLPRDKAPTA